MLYLKQSTTFTPMYGAGEGNRTLDNSLEGCGFTTKLHPHNNIIMIFIVYTHVILAYGSCPCIFQCCSEAGFFGTTRCVFDDVLLVTKLDPHNISMMYLINLTQSTLAYGSCPCIFQCCSDDGFFGTTRRLGDDVSLVTKLHDQMKLFSNDVLNYSNYILCLQLTSSKDSLRRILQNQIISVD